MHFFVICNAFFPGYYISGSCIWKMKKVLPFSRVLHIWFVHLEDEKSLVGSLAFDYLATFWMMTNHPSRQEGRCPGHPAWSFGWPLECPPRVEVLPALP